eukprot:4935406-Pyramimonas_sp.AAC.1
MGYNATRITVGGEMSANFWRGWESGIDGAGARGAIYCGGGAGSARESGARLYSADPQTGDYESVPMVLLLFRPSRKDRPRRAGSGEPRGLLQKQKVLESPGPRAPISRV